MNEPNKHIVEFLDYYCSLTSPPEYAVLIKGKWGCGKTWFVKKYCEHLKKTNQKNLYVSLYGMTSYNEIENSFFQQIHPILSSKGMALTGKILKGLLKTSIKVDLDGDKTSETTVSSQIPEINLPKEFTTADNNILIFDDLERCGIKGPDILGYINHYVEHQGFRVIVLANEDDIIKKDKKKTNYINIKEKLIGKTFEIVSDINEAISHFTSLIDDDNVKKIINDNIRTIKDIYRSSEYENLRHLKQSLWDLERFYKSLNKEFTSNNDFNTDFIKLFLAFSFEIKSGAIRPEEIPKLSSSYLEGILTNKNKEKSKCKKISEKYNSIEFYNRIIELSAWVLFFDKGIIDQATIQESISKSKYFQDKNTPNWVKLWHFLDLTDDEYIDLYNIVQQEFDDRAFNEVEIIKHVSGMFLWFSELGLIEKTKKQIVDEAKKYIDELNENNMLDHSNFQEPFDDESWGGLGFSGKDLSEFTEINEYIKAKTEESKIDRMPEAAARLLALMGEDTKKFYNQVVHNNSEDNLYYETPILKYINPNEFVNAFEKITPENRRIVSLALAERYKYYTFLNNIYEEMDWLRSVKKVMSEKQQLLRGKVSGYIIQSAIDRHIDKSLKILKEYSKEKG